MANNTKMNISYTIRAVDRFTKVHQKLERQLSSVQRKVNSLSKMDHTVNVDIDYDDKDFTKGVQKVESGLNKVDNSMKKVQKTADKTSKIQVGDIDKKSLQSLTSLERRIKSMTVDIREIPDIEADADVDTKAAIKDIDKIERKISRLNKEMDLEVEISKSLDGTEDHIQGLRKELQRSSSLMDKLKKKAIEIQDADIRADVEAEKAKAELEALEQKAEDVPNNIFIRAWVNHREAMQKLERMGQKWENMEDFAMGMLKGVAMSLSTTLSPALSVAAGGVGAIGSAFVSAGTGAAGFAAVAVPEILDVVDANKKLKAAQQAVEDASNPEERQEALKKLKQLQSQYNDEQMKSVSVLRDFQNYFGDLRKQFQDESLSAFRKSLNALRRIMELSEPAIQGVADATNNILDALNRNLEADDMQRFFEWVGNTAGPYFEKLTKAVGNFFAGFLNMMVAFDPLAQSFSDGFLDMSERFREWANQLSESDDFQRFVSFVRENTPTLLSLIGNIIMTLINFGEAMAPVGEKVLEMADKFFEWTSSLMETHPWIAKVLGIGMSLFGLLRLLSPVLGILGGAFKTLKGPIKNVWTKFGGFKGILKKVMPWVGRLGSKLLAFLGPVGLVASTVMTLADIFDITWQDIGKATQAFWEWLPDWLTGPIDSMGQTIIGFWDKITGKSSESTSKMKTTTQSDLTAMDMGFSQKLSGMQTTTDSKFGLMAQTVGTRSAEMKTNAQTNLFGMDSDFMTNLSSMDSTVATKFGSMDSTVAADMESMWSTANSDLSAMGVDFDSNLTGMNSDVMSQFGSMNSTVASDMSAMNSDVMTNWQSASSETTAKNAAMQREVAMQFAQQYSVVMAKMKQMYSTIQNLWNAAQGFLRSINLYSIGSNIIQGLISGISSVSVFGAVSRIAGNIKSAFTSFFDIHSPSRLMEKDVGKNITLGVLDGIVGMQSRAEREAEMVAKAIARPFESMNREYQFGATGTAEARNRYDVARRGYAADSGSSGESPASGGVNQPQYAVVNIGGHEARGTIQYITEEQEREKRINEKFK